MAKPERERATDVISGSAALVRRIFRENGRDYAGTYALVIACLLFVSASTAFVAWIMRDVIDQIFYAQRKDLIVAICAAIFVTFILRGIATYTQSVALSKIGNNLAARYQGRILDKLMSLDMRFFSGAHSGALTARLSENVNGIRDILNMTLTSVTRDIVTLFALVAVMVWQDPVLSLLTLVVAPPLILGVGHLARRVRGVTHESVMLNSRLLGSIQETVQGIGVVKAYTMEDTLSDRIRGLIAAAESRANKIARVSERTAPIAETLAGFAVASVLAYSGYRASYQSVPPGATFSFITALLLAYDPARRLARMQINLERALVNARMVYEVLDMVPGEPDHADAPALAVLRGKVEFGSVSFAYEAGLPVLTRTSFVAEPGRTTAIVGPSGSGKSTIASLLMRFYDPDSGAISIDGTDIKTVTKHSLRNAIAYVSQQAYLFEGTIRDNIRFGRPDASDADVEEAARQAFAHDFIMDQPRGYDTQAGENGGLLSGGQRQRISIARALLRNAPVLLLDEATSALDNDSERQVQAALEKVTRNRTTIVIAHRLSTIMNADKIIALLDGQVVEQGTHDQLKSRPGGLYARFIAMQNGAGVDTAPAAEPAKSRRSKKA